LDLIQLSLQLVGIKLQYHLMQPILNNLNFLRNNLPVFLCIIHNREMQHEDGTLDQVYNCQEYKRILFDQIQMLQIVFIR
jgi:hypothetical protein